MFKKWNRNAAYVTAFDLNISFLVRTNTRTHPLIQRPLRQAVVRLLQTSMPPVPLVPQYNHSAGVQVGGAYVWEEHNGAAVLVVGWVYVSLFFFQKFKIAV